MFLRSLLGSLVVCALLVVPAAAQDVPRVVSFGGQADAGTPVSKPVSVTIAIYDDAAATSPLFLETHVVQLTPPDRRFTVLLGSATGGGLPAALFANNAARWIGVQVASHPEQAPRIMVVSVPYALKSADADKLGGLPASEYLTEFDPSSANAYTDAQVAAEAAARAAADTTLQFNIDAEAAARANADSTLQGNIDAEAAARAAADTTLQFNIDAEAAARAAGDTTLQGNIDAEAAARAAADTTLQFNIDAEAAARAQGDIDTLAAANTYTNAQVAAEAAARAAADTTLQFNIDAEAAARAQGDINTLAAANAYTNSSVAAEAAARAAADTTLQSNIDAVAGSALSSLSAGTGISITGSGNSRTITNTGDTNGADDINALSAGTGISISGSGGSRTITNTGDTSTFDDITGLFPGPGLSIIGSGNNRDILVNTPVLFGNANGVTFGNGGSGAFRFNSIGSVNDTCTGTPLVTGARTLTFPTDPGDGCGDAAYLAYYVKGGTVEDTVLELGISNDSNDDIALMASGGVGIGTRTPAFALDVAGTTRVICLLTTSGGSFGTCSSDARLKKSVRPFTGLLDKVTALQPVSFEWNPAETSALHLSGQSFGLIAQDVEKVLPEMVTNDGPGGYKAVHYDMLPMMMLQAMRELKEENDTLKRALADQAARLQAIEAAIKK